MTEISPEKVIEKLYTSSLERLGSHSVIQTDINNEDKAIINFILENSERAKGVLTVIVTSLVYKIIHPEQDVRNHQADIPNGYSGRSFDSKYITPFLKTHKFPAMSESGWLTRSLEQKVPYNDNYSGAIQPAELKIAFLGILNNIQMKSCSKEYLDYLIQGLIIKRNQQQIDLAKPQALSINSILEVLTKHFNRKYTAEGASRLPVIAIYAAYMSLIVEMKRFDKKQLLTLESHTSSDARSGRIGDIDLVDEKNRAFEAVEVKFNIPITLQLVQDSYTKFQTTSVDRYYILSTVVSNLEEQNLIENEIRKIKNIHGCQLIVNGIMPTLKYYLRLLNSSNEFIENYVNLLENDKALKFEHKVAWNKIIGELK